MYLIKYTHLLYFILIILLSLFPVNGLFCHCVVATSAFVPILFCISYQCLHQYFHTLQNLILLCNKPQIILSCIVPNLFLQCCHPYQTEFTISDQHLFIWIYHLFISLSLKHIYWFLIYQYIIYFCFLVYFCLLLLWKIFIFHIQHSKTCNQCNIYTILVKI